MNKKSVKLLQGGVVLSLFASTLLHATNGDTLIGVGTKSRGMGGAGIGMSHCAESTLQNPALITCTKGTSVSFGGTIFMPDISADNGAGFKNSASDMNMIPSLAISQKVNENWYWGIGMWGTAGMGVDYRNDPSNMNMVTNLQLMQFGATLAYTKNNFGVAITPILQYGSLDINYDNNGTNVGAGVSQDFGTGYNLGVYYDYGNGLTLGGIYKSKIEMKYNGQLSTATAGMGMSMEDYLDQPSEMGVGFAYKVGEHAFAVDYKKINWSDARGYKDFNWKDQDVYAVGYQLSKDKYRYRIGYNYANHPIEKSPDSRINVFNLLGFPGTAETHYTAGLGYDISKNMYVDVAYVYAPETTTTMPNPFPSGNTTVKHSEQGLSLQLSYRFF